MYQNFHEIKYTFQSINFRIIKPNAILQYNYLQIIIYANYTI